MNKSIVGFNLQQESTDHRVVVLSANRHGLAGDGDVRNLREVAEAVPLAVGLAAQLLGFLLQVILSVVTVFSSLWVGDGELLQTYRRRNNMR